MVPRVLVAMDDSAPAERVLRYALETHPGAAVTVLHVVGEPSAMMGRTAALALGDGPESAAEPVLERARRVAEEYDATVDTAVAWGQPAREITERAVGFDTVVVGSHAGSLRERLFVGDVAGRVVRRSSVTVTVVR